ncbi:hypothetical protein JQ833_09685 [Brachyspira hyodysenteriae]|uniref:hypothetical protein n=1 Tax=Brachyspira hyodysenteriae TaxID=159 RepID=UPI001BFC3AD1|nr:hypothetical protein [Brachyspira hyodysenteriae]MBT8744411.1 hypothetical protein [Brachyspira hyodysenteriae]MBT8748758.1 hypothetical protein [Brachyspira hyodysenteriae]MBT8756388.1 hypothetical protein [Brachyspira hyodysenteriae]MCZ9885436.1 hypothetical protein [Brachyspira hyodysenteriae]MDA0022492.1 hypothetical protein [Brachyspira hyodysenteriae]
MKNCNKDTLPIEIGLNILLKLYLFWLGLAWLGLAWLGLAWLGLAWLGLAWNKPNLILLNVTIICPILYHNKIIYN